MALSSLLSRSPPPTPPEATAPAALAAFTPLLGLGVAALVWRLWHKPALISGEGRWVLITGCDSGFGQGLARAALQAGFSVVAACYTEEGAMNLQDTAAQIVKADLTTSEGLARVVDAVKAACGGERLFALVNNAGICLPGNVEWLPMKTYEVSMALMFHAPVALTYELLPLLKAAKGRVVNVTSVDGFIALPTNAPYVAAKHALEAYSDTLRCEMLPWGVKVVVVEPGTMRTPLSMGFADAWLQSYREADPQRKAPYGDAWAEHVAATTRKGLEALAADPAQTVAGLMRALRLPEPPTRLTTGRAARLLFKPLSALPDVTRDRLLHAMSFTGPPAAGLAPRPARPPAGVVSHVTIRVKELARSVAWYQHFGLSREGEAEGGAQLLQAGRHAKWTPRVLLVEDAAMGARGASYDAGMTRLCIYSADLPRAVRRLAAAGLQPMAPAGGKAGTIAAYSDPDGFVVYLIMFHLPLSPIFWAVRWWHRVTDPQLFHWTVNVTQIEGALAIFDALGFAKVYDAPPQQPQYDMLPPFGIAEAGAAIRHIRLCKLPEDSFCATLMEWTSPRTERKGAEHYNALTLAVADVGAALAKAEAAGARTEPPARRRLPVLGVARVGVVVVDGSRVEVCEFV